MIELCIFCGAETPAGCLVCPDCEPKRETLSDDQRRLLEKLEADEKARDDFLQAVERTKAIIVQAWENISSQFEEWCKSIADILAKNVVAELTDGLKFVNAYIWACDAHPKWVNVLNHTKKKRTRKKYQDRIFRAYLEMKKEG